MLCFMMWMSGSGVQIFSIMMTFTGLLQPLKALAGSRALFARMADPGVDLSGPRALFCLVNLAGLCFALYKLDGMGLLPTHASDWMSKLPAPLAAEFVSPGSSLL